MIIIMATQIVTTNNNNNYNDNTKLDIKKIPTTDRQPFIIILIFFCSYFFQLYTFLF